MPFACSLKSPGFTAVAVITLALGIGANTGIFSVVNAVLIRPMPYREPDRLVVIHQTDLKKGWNWVPPSPADFLDWREQNQVFEEIAAFRVWFHSLAGTDGAENVLGVRTSANFFHLLGIGAALGRTFLADEEQPGRDQVVLLTHGLWQRRFGSDPTAIGKTVTIDDRPFTIVGILPPEFRFMRFFRGDEFELWMPLALEPSQLSRAEHSVSVYGRLNRKSPLPRPRRKWTPSTADWHNSTRRRIRTSGSRFSVWSKQIAKPSARPFFCWSPPSALCC